MARILYFGRLTDVTGQSFQTLPLPSDIWDTAGLRRWADASHGGSGALLDETVRIAINNEIVSEPAAVSDTDEIAFMPPVGGG